MLCIVSMVAAYLLGAVPFGLIIARAHHIDLRKIGSGNIGATNVSRALGKQWGYLCFGLDMLKGLIPTLMALWWLKPVMVRSGAGETAFLWVWLGTGCAAIAGHVLPIYVRFKGGKGVATSFGVALGLWPYFTLCAGAALVVWLITLQVWRYVSLASILASAAFPIFLFLAIACIRTWSMAHLWPLAIVALAIPCMVVIRHRENIRRLRTGTEHKIKTRDRGPLDQGHHRTERAR